MGLANIVKLRALEAGFDLVGIAPPAVLPDLEFLSQWLRKGYGGEMRYLADPRREDPRCVLPTVKSVLCVGLFYNTPYPYSTQVDSNGSGATTEEAGPRAWISRYAWGEDYHKTMRRKLEQLQAALEGLAPGTETRAYVDAGPIMERAFARHSGIGWMGKNTCLINEHRGSWFFLGVILTNLDLEIDSPAPDRCGSCTRCLDACPTGALVEPYKMDASRCISYLNIELKGSIPIQFRGAMGNNVFGCDICQDVCPWNNRHWSLVAGPSQDVAEYSSGGGQRRKAATTNLPKFQPLQANVGAHGPASLPATLSLFNPPLQALASLTEEDFRRIFARSPIKRAKYRGWLRNLCVAIGNSRDPRFIPWLEAAVNHLDPLVSEHAAWALARLREKTFCRKS